MEVLRVTAGDGPRLKQVRLAALEDAPSAFGSTHESEASRTDAEWAQRAVAGSHGSDRATFFAQLDEEIVGLAGGYREERFSLIVELVSMWVAPRVRGGSETASSTQLQHGPERRTRRASRCG